ncbi:MAG: DUF1330 domain-containing protein [Pseudomonadota bacterium]
MLVKNALMPDSSQVAGFVTENDSDTIYMVNMLKYRDRAEYADGRKSNLTGREAYRLYAEGVRGCLEKVGGGVHFAGEVRRLVIGEVGELWDDIVIAVYPNRAAMLQMMQLPEMAEIGEHRSAGLAGQLNIETVMSPDF